MPTIFVNNKSKILKIKTESNNTILDIAKKNKLDIEGSCEGSLACSTCHILINKKWMKKVGDACLSEIEMLELLPNIRENSRLGCQIVVTDELDGLEITLPDI